MHGRLILKDNYFWFILKLKILTKSQTLGLQITTILSFEVPYCVLHSPEQVMRVMRASPSSAKSSLGKSA